MSPVQIKKKSAGGALLTALFIMTLVAIVATAMSIRLQVDIYRTRLIVMHDKLYFAAQSVGLWAMTELYDSKKHFNKANTQGMVSTLPKNGTNIYPSVRLSGELYDLQSRVNLNNLSNKKSVLGFVNFLSFLAPQLSTAERVNLSLAINYWVSPFDLDLGKDNYLAYYLTRKPPYQPSHQFMTSSSELRLIKGVTPKVYLALEPFITALPQETALNINTASKQSLMSLSTAINAEKADDLIKARGKNGVKSMEKLDELLKKFNIAREQLTMESIYFLSVAHASSENLNLTVYTLLKKSRNKKDKVSVTILRESFNIF